MQEPEKKHFIERQNNRSLFLDLLLYNIKRLLKQKNSSVHGFTFKNWKDLRPMEDSYNFNNNTFAIADGITRDPLGMPTLPTTGNIPGMARFFWNYPKTTPGRSPATEAADIFTFSFLYHLETIQKRDEEAILEAFNKANMYIKEMNERCNPNPDFLENDYWSCVAAGATIEGNKLSYGFISDCGLAVFDSNKDAKFMTENEGPNSKGSIDDDIKKRYGSNFQSPFGRRKIRKEYRNQIQNPLSYGALTGESQAMNFVRTGTIDVAANDTLVLYTDGLEETIMSEEFRENLRNWKRLRKICKERVATQGSIIIKYPLIEY